VLNKVGSIDAIHTLGSQRLQVRKGITLNGRNPGVVHRLHSNRIRVHSGHINALCSEKLYKVAKTAPQIDYPFTALKELHVEALMLFLLG